MTNRHTKALKLLSNDIPNKPPRDTMSYVTVLCLIYFFTKNIVNIDNDMEKQSLGTCL